MYAYDGLDRPTGATHSVTGAVGHGWDLAGRRTSVAVSGGLGSGAPAVGYGYDDAGRLTAVTKGGVNYATATYDPAGRLGTVTRYNSGAAGAVTTYGYDNADRLTGLTTAQGGTTLGDFGYTYARNGQMTQAVEAIGGTSRTVSYTYDGLLRLTGATSPGGTTYAYGYDPVGNRTSVTVNGGAPQTKSYDAADQVVGWTYDSAGNLLGDGTTTYTYDPLGRLASATASGATTTYGYDGDHTLALRAAGGSTTRYAIDTQGGLSERLGAVTTTGGGPATSAWYVRGWGGELGRETATGTAWYLADRLGSVHAEYGATGVVGVRTTYDPFGQPEGGPGLVAPSDYGFTGEPQEAGTGLVQLRARWYQPAHGQFTTRDPFTGDPAKPMSFGPYTYAYDDPVNRIDPTGLSPALDSDSGSVLANIVGIASPDEEPAHQLGNAGFARRTAGCADESRYAAPPIQAQFLANWISDLIEYGTWRFVGYHGTILSSAEDIAYVGIRTPSTPWNELQLGIGFYVALDLKVAEDWAMLRQREAVLDAGGRWDEGFRATILDVYARGFRLMNRGEDCRVDNVDKWFQITPTDPLITKCDYLQSQIQGYPPGIEQIKFNPKTYDTWRVFVWATISNQSTL